MPTDASKPVRLRSACNSCHAAKTKCSGQKTGCDRCADLDLPCKYEVSMVGKIAGIRSKNRRKSRIEITDHSTQCTCTAASSATSSGTIATTGTTTTVAPTGFPVQSQHPMTPWSPSVDFQMNLFSLQHLEGSMDVDAASTGTPLACGPSTDSEMELWFNAGPNMQESTNEIQTAGGSPSVISLGFSGPGLSEVATEPSPASCLKETATPADSDVGNLDELGSISVCADIIKALVGILNAKSRTLDAVLSACRSHITRLSAIIKDDDFEHSTGCRTIVLTALNLVICLFERCVHVEEEPTTKGPPFSDGRRFRFRFPLPRVSFGSIQLDNGEQFAFCSQLMGEELSRTLAVVGSLTQRGVNRNCKAAISAANIQEVWCEDFKHRLQALLNLLGRTTDESNRRS
ncbi:hypothetical protein F4776DRAFT_325759 [Hypoxylon sp. NC0597]|nr:hypothetical protein F4776DRAFT_325759 [Hypoxylon sp. NC0597]